LLESSIDGARGVVFNITGGSDLTLHEVNAAAEIIYEVVDPNANIIFGAVIDDRLQGELRITVIATGFTGEPIARQTAKPTAIRRSTASPAPTTAMPASAPATTPPPQKPAGLDIPEFLQRRRPPR
jgi:cell division protein FtsZ